MKLFWAYAVVPIHLLTSAIGLSYVLVLLLFSGSILCLNLPGLPVIFFLIFSSFFSSFTRLLSPIFHFHFMYHCLIVCSCCALMPSFA